MSVSWWRKYWLGGNSWHGLLLAAFVTWFGSMTLSAAVRFDMFVGYDGVVPQGSWFPIAFEVANDGPAFTGIVEVTGGQFSSGQTRLMKVELPTGTTKRLVIPTFSAASFNPSWNARLVDEHGKVYAETSSLRLRRFNDAVLPLPAAMSRAVPPLPELKSRSEELRPVFARLQPALFPDDPLTLEGLNTLYLGSERALDLKANQVGALMAWVYAGGHLVVGLEQANHLTGSGEWLHRMLPCEIGGVTSMADHTDLQVWLTGKSRFDGFEYDFSRDASSRSYNKTPFNPYASLSVDNKFESAPLQLIQCRRRDGKVLMGPEQAPLAIGAKRGRGQITVLAFAPELEPFRSWKNAPHFWAKMIDLPPALLGEENVGSPYSRPVDGVVGAMIDSEQARKLPVGWLLLLLVAYLVVIGPLDQYWLKKLNRQMLTWLTFPAYVVFFSLLIYYIGYRLRAGEIEWSELHFLDITPHGESADVRGRSYGSIYSPVNARYTFGGDEVHATMRGEYSGAYGSAQDAGSGTVEQRPAGFRAVAAVPVWTSHLFLSDWWRQGPNPIRVEMTDREITIVNELEAELTFVRLVAEGQVLDLGNVAAGERKTFARGNANVQSLRSFVENNSRRFERALQARQQAFGDDASARIKDWANASMALSFVSEGYSSSSSTRFSSSPGFDLAPLVRRGDAVLLAWAANYSPTKSLNQFPAKQGKKSTLVRVIVTRS